MLSFPSLGLEWSEVLWRWQWSKRRSASPSSELAVGDAVKHPLLCDWWWHGEPANSVLICGWLLLTHTLTGVSGRLLADAPSEEWHEMVCLAVVSVQNGGDDGSL